LARRPCPHRWRSNRKQCRHGDCAECIDADWTGDVFDLLLAHILERVGKLVADLVAHHSRDAHASRFSQYLQTSRHIHAVAENIITLGDDVAEIDPNAEPDPPVFGHIGFMVEHCALGFYRAAYSIQYARKFHQHAVAGGLDDAPMVLGDLRIDELVAQRVETFEGAFFVRSHQPRVAGDIGGRGSLQACGWRP